MEKRMLDLHEIAERLLMSKVNNDTFHGWELRKGKTTDDINKAVRKGLNPKFSFGKFELEVKMVEVYLKDVLKKKRNSNKQKETESISKLN